MKKIILNLPVLYNHSKAREKIDINFFGSIDFIRSRIIQVLKELKTPLDEEIENYVVYQPTGFNTEHKYEFVIESPKKGERTTRFLFFIDDNGQMKFNILIRTNDKDGEFLKKKEVEANGFKKLSARIDTWMTTRDLRNLFVEMSDYMKDFCKN